MGIQERRKRERETRRHQIMVAAKNVFYQKGFSKSTMEDIARAAELSPGTLYLYFKNKDELYASLSLRVLQYLLIRLEEVEKQTDIKARKRLALLQEAIYDVYEFDPVIFVKMFHLQSGEAYPNLTSQLRTDISDLTGKSLQVLARLLKAGLTGQDIISQNYGKLAEMLWAFFSGVVLFEANKKMAGDKNGDLKATLKAALEIFFRGIQQI
jgi:AcrR family transcriptional regulator